MIRAREYLDANSIQQQIFEQNVLMDLKGLQIQASDLWGPGRVTNMNNLLLNSYDTSYELQLVLGPPQNFDNDPRLNTQQIAQIAKLLRTLPTKNLSIKLDLGNTNHRAFLRLLKSTLKKIGRLNNIIFNPNECQSSSWVEILSVFRKTQASKVSIQMIESQFFSNKEKMRSVLLQTLDHAEEFTFKAFPLKVTNRITWFADTQRTMDVFKNLRKIHLDPFSLEDPYYYNYQRLFNTIANLEDVSLVCHNRDFFKQADTNLTFPVKLKRLSITFASLWDKDSMKNIFNSIFTKQADLVGLESLQVIIKNQPVPGGNQAPPLLKDYAFLQNLTCPNLKSLTLHLDLIRRVSLTGLEKLSKLESLDLALGYNVEKIKFAENQPFPENLKRLRFHYGPEKPLSEHKREIHHSFLAFLTKHLKNPQSTLATSLLELHFSEANMSSEMMQNLCLSSLENLSFHSCFFLEKDLTKLLNSERLTSLKSLKIQSSLLKDKSFVNERLFQIITESLIASQIEELNIEKMDFGDGNWETVKLTGRQLPKLKKLSLLWNSKLTFKGLMKILQIEMPHLEYLNLESVRCPYNELQGLLLKRVPHLKELKLDANLFQIGDIRTTMEFKENFFKAISYGVFKSRV